MSIPEWIKELFFIWIPLLVSMMAGGYLFALPTFFEDDPMICVPLKIFQALLGVLFGLFAGVAMLVYVAMGLTWIQGGRF